MICASVAIAAPQKVKNNWYNKLYVRADAIGFIPNKFKKHQASDGDADVYAKKSPRKGVAHNIGLGYRLNDEWRGDLNFSYRNLDYKAQGKSVNDPILIQQRTRIYNVFFNGYYDFNFHEIIKPYLTAGVGYSRSDSGSLSSIDSGSELTANDYLGEKKSNFAWNIGIGSKFILSDRFSFDISYKYVDLGKSVVRPTEWGISTLNYSPLKISQKLRFHDIMGGVIIHDVATSQKPKNSYNKLYVRADVIGFIPNKFKKHQESDGNIDVYVKKSPRKGVAHNIGLGYILNNKWRGDLNFSYRNLDYKAQGTNDDDHPILIQQRTRIYNVFFNGYYDFNFHEIIKPYLTAGVGCSRSDSGSLSTTIPASDEFTVVDYFGEKKNNFAWNIGIGSKFILSDRFSFDISYKYVDLGKSVVRPTKNNIDGGYSPLKISQKLRFHDIMGGVIIRL